MQQAPSETVAPAASGNAMIVRNAALLLAAQLITTPFAVVVNAVMARHIGAAEFGRLYLASTFCGFGFLVVDWGQGLTLPAAVAKDRTRAGELLLTALVWRFTVALAVSALLCSGSLAFGLGYEFAAVLLLVALGLMIGSISGACQETVRGFERTDVMAYAQVGGQLFSGSAAIATLVAGGGLRSVLLVQAACGLVVLAFVWRAVGRVGVGRLAFRSATLRELFTSGVPFLMFAVAMALQSNIDALFLSRLVPNEVVGWHAAARRLVGVLVFPATAVVGALYPTLCRLYASDPASYVRTTSTALRTTTVLAVPLALGCFLFPDVGIRIFSRDSFGPAEDNLRVMAPFLFLLYFSMPLGCALLAGGKQRAWSLVQVLCVVFSLALDPLLIPWFQQRTGNGGLGVCVAGLASEMFMVGLGVWLAARGVFNRELVLNIGRALLAGCAMLAVGRLLGGLGSLLAAPIALVAYGVTLWLVGGVEREQIAALRERISRKLSRTGSG